MKRKWWVVAAAAVIGIAVAAGIVLFSRRIGVQTPSLETQKEKLSYSMGVAVAQSWKRQAVDLDIQVVAEGMSDALSGEEIRMTEAEMRETIAAFRQELKKRASGARTASEDRRKKDEALLAENALRKGVVALPNGLQYEVLTEGRGRIPVDGDLVQVHYRGTRLDGTEFASTYPSKKPAMLLVSRSLPAWKEALKRMPVGSKWRLYAPSHLAYGQRGLRSPRGRALQVEPNMPVIFELELLAIRSPESLGAHTAAGTAPSAANREN